MPAKRILPPRLSGWAALLLSFSLSFSFPRAADLSPLPTTNAAPVLPAAPAQTNSLLQRVVLIGASVTAGFTEPEPLGGPATDLLRLSRYVEAAVAAPHDPVQSFGLSLFFLRPELAGQTQIERALRESPTLLIGIDFLFWYCYGEVPNEEARLQRFETGLRLLATVSSPLVLGDLPDASAAVNHMISPAQMPQQATLAAANRRLQEWAASRPNVHLIRLSAFMRTALANDALTIHGRVLPKGTTRTLLQADNLHATRDGCAVLALAIMDVLASSPGLAPATSFRWDPKEVLRLAVP